MNHLLVFVVLVIAPYSHCHHPDSEPPEKIKLSSEPGYYYPEQKSDHHYEHQTGPPTDNVEKNYQSERKVDDAPSNYEFYKPLNKIELYGPSEEDSKYIPHSKAFSKYINPKGSLSSKNEHEWEDGEDKTKSEEIPRYGFTRQNHHDTPHEHHVNENSENIPREHYDESHKPTYAAHSQHKYHEEDTEHHKPYPEHKEQYRNNDDYPKHEEKHSHHPHYVEHEEHEHHPYSDKKSEHGHHHYADHGEYNHHHHPEHKGKDHHYYPEHQSEQRRPHYPQEEDNGHHHYPKHEVEYHHYSEHKNENQHHPNHNVEHGPYHHGTKEHNNHHADEKHTLQHQHWKDKHPGSFTTVDGDALIDEIKKSKPHYFLDKKSKLHDDKISHVPDVEELIGKHKVESHKPLQLFNGEGLHHKTDLDDSKKEHHHLNHYPLAKNTNHEEHHHKPLVHYKPNFNVGGHSYGWMYNSKFDIYQEMKKDLALKMRLLKEHEEKLSELQRNHLHKYRALFEPHHMKKFLKHEIPEYILRNTEPAHYVQPVNYRVHEHENSPSPLKYGTYSKEPAVSYEPKHHPHHESHHPHRESHHPHHESHHPHHESHHPKHDSHHPKHDSRYEEHKHYSNDPHHHKASYTP